MEIVWYGLSCFRLSERGLVSVVTDPYDPSIGLPPLKLRRSLTRACSPIEIKTKMKSQSR